MKPRALLSVTDKSHVVEFAQGLLARGFELLSTGGTAKALREAGLPVTDVSAVTEFPEILDGRVKTLHPKIHGGLLGDTTLELHREQMAQHGIAAIEVVAVNLYPFAATVQGEHTWDDAVENIDIGGPAMIRAAAKNAKCVWVVVDPTDYPRVLADLDAPSTLREELRAKAFRHTAAYDAMIARYFSGDALEEVLPLPSSRVSVLRYGENPHQRGAVYMDPLQRGGIAHAELLWGKELSYNNLLDADAAWELVSDLPGSACAIIKHGNPCGVATGSDFGESYRVARACDPISAFGGIAAFRGPVDAATAEAMTEKGNFLEVVIATDFTEEAIAKFRSKAGWGQSVRLLKAVLAPETPFLSVRSIRGGYVVQSSDEDPQNEWKLVTDRAPTEEEWSALRLAWSIVRHVKSNGIVLAQSQRLLGVGAGQMNRVQSVRLALEQAGAEAAGAVLASDAFFPFPDSIQTAGAAGVKAVIQPGGSKKDDESIQAANELGMAMVLTGNRCFRH